MMDGQRPEDKARGDQREEAPPPPTAPKEIGGPQGPEPTRFNDWEKRGRCTDF